MRNESISNVISFVLYDEQPKLLFMLASKAQSGFAS